MKKTERERLLKIARMALEAGEILLDPMQTHPVTSAHVMQGTKLAETAAIIFSAIAADETARLLRRAARRKATSGAELEPRS